jgi:hypothetical protein
MGKEELRMAGFRPDVDEALEFLVAKGCDVKPGIIDSEGGLRIPVDWNALTFGEVIELAASKGHVQNKR